MPKVTGPLFSLKARGQFAKRFIFKRGGIVVNYFKPRNPNSAAQQAQREAFKEFSVPSLTQEQADLLYAAILHNHDGVYSPVGHNHNDLYSLLNHLHDGRYSQLGHNHNDLYSALYHNHNEKLLLGGHAAGQTLASGASGILSLFATGFISVGGNVPIPIAGTLKNLYVRIPGTQPASGSLVFTVMKNNSTSALTCTCSAGAAGVTISDLTHSVSVSAGDLIYLSAQNNATGVSAQVGSFNLTLEFSIS